MKNRINWVLVALTTAAVCSAAAQTPQTNLVNQTFKEDPDGWVGVGQAAKVSVSHDPVIALPSAGALKFDYVVAKGDVNMVYLPAVLGAWTKAKSFKFRVHADVSTAIAVILQEQDGGRYTTMINLPKDTWQTIELSTSDFILSQDKDDPKDPDGKLDMDRVNALSILDVAQFVASLDNAPLAELFGIQKGAHTLYVDSFTVSTESAPATAASTGSMVQLDTLVHPQLSWIGLGGVKLARSQEKPLEGLGIRADYHVKPGKPIILSHPLQSWILTGTKTLSFDIASAQPTKIIVQVEQYDGGKYNMTIEVPGGSVIQHKTLLFSGFIRGDDSTDTDTKVHLAQVKSIMFGDISGMTDQADRDNTLWLNHIVAN